MQCCKIEKGSVPTLPQKTYVEIPLGRDQQCLKPTRSDIRPSSDLISAVMNHQVPWVTPHIEWQEASEISHKE